MPFTFAIFISDIGQCFRTVQTKSLENEIKSGVGSRRATDNKRQQAEFRNYRQTGISYFCLTLAYMVHLGLNFCRKCKK